MRVLKSIVFSLILLLTSANIAFAADVLVKGNIIDTQEKSVGMSFISFLNSKGQKIVSTSTDSNGAYSVMIEQGTYTIEASGPAESKFQKTTLKDQTFNSDTEKDVVLSQGSILSSGGIPWIPIFIIAAIFVAVTVFLIVRRRNSS